MKPIKLILSAFGPYAGGAKIISFEEFEGRGVFLICGDTGAGKTTIFDGISYALYGHASGSYRDPKNLRSEYAKESEESFVDFYFSHQGRNYHVTRYPAYERNKKRGAGKVSVPEKSAFYEEDKPPIEGTSQVNAAIRELLHIDERQFKQIAMIPQGEFLALINAKTEERTGILRTIFMTDSYKRLEFVLKERLDDAYKEKMNLTQAIKQYFFDAVVSTGSEYHDVYKEISDGLSSVNNVWNIDELTDVLNNIVSEDEICLTKENEALKIEEKTSEEIKEKLSKIRARAGIKERLKVLREELPKAMDNVKENEEKYAFVLKDKEKADERKSFAERINSEREKYKKRDEISESIKALTEKNEVYKKDILVQEKNKVELKDKEKALLNEIEQYKDAKDRLTDVNNKKERTENAYSEIDKLISLKDDMHAKQNYFIKQREIYENDSEKLREAEICLENSRAGLLAASLSEGDECPVCGSVHHPRLAKLPECAMTETEFKKIKERSNKSLEEKNKALSAAEAAKALYDDEALRASDALLLCGKEENDAMTASDVKALLLSLSDEIKDYTQLINSLKKSVVRSEKCFYELETLRNETMEKLAFDLEEIKKSQQKNEIELSEKKTVLDGLAELSYNTWDIAKQHMDDAVKIYTDIYTKIEEAVKDLNDAKSNYSQIKRAIEEMEKTSEDSAADIEVDINELEENEKAVSERIKSLREEKSRTEIRINLNKEKLNAILSKRSAHAESEKRFGDITRVYSLIKGQTGGSKITFEQYIQSTGFDGIISAANRRLIPMSEGRFEMYRQSDSYGKKSNTFLDLEVLDNYTGKRRPVGTLSGGESFKASLSLALGLSDTVSADNGGVQIDALFIDEGFGALDKRSIDGAMEVLSSLTEKGKLIGIISHREELTESIPRQIRVIKSPKGSDIEVYDEDSKSY